VDVRLLITVVKLGTIPMIISLFHAFYFIFVFIFCHDLLSSYHLHLPNRLSLFLLVTADNHHRDVIAAALIVGKVA